MNHKCEDCYYFRVSEDVIYGYGRCMFNPPVAIDKFGQCRRPVTSREDFCGQFFNKELSLEKM